MLQIQTLNFVQFQQDGLELVVDTSTGAAFASQSALARMVGVSKQAISQYLSVNKRTQLQAEIVAGGGMKTVSLSNEDTIYDIFAKYKPELLVQCAKAGIRVYLHKLAGFEVTSTAVEPIVKTALELAREQVALLEQLEMQAQLIAEQAPKVLMAEELMQSTTCIDIGQFAKLTYDLFGFGRNKMFDKLIELNVLQSYPHKNEAYQKYILRGYFESIEVVNGTLLNLKTLVTPKGQEWLIKKLIESKALVHPQNP